MLLKDKVETRSPHASYRSLPPKRARRFSLGKAEASLPGLTSMQRSGGSAGEIPGNWSCF